MEINFARSKFCSSEVPNLKINSFLFWGRLPCRNLYLKAVDNLIHTVWCESSLMTWIMLFKSHQVWSVESLLNYHYCTHQKQCDSCFMMWIKCHDMNQISQLGAFLINRNRSPTIPLLYNFTHKNSYRRHIWECLWLEKIFSYNNSTSIELYL